MSSVEAVGCEADGVAFFEEDLDVFRLVRARLRGRPKGHTCRVSARGGGVIPRVFEHAGFEGDVEQVAVHRVGLLHRGLDRDVVASAA